MTFATDERAQSTLVGAILLFAILTIAFSSYQAFVVPNQNAEVEFNHNLEVQSDMQDLRNSLLDVRSVERIDEGDYSVVSEHRPARVRLGTRYPERLIALNPPAPSGTLRTVEPHTGVRIENAVVNETRASNFNGNLSVLFDSHETTFIAYQPRYSEYRNSPNTVFEHSLLYNDFSDSDLIVRQQNVVNTSQNRITIVLFDGDLDRSSSQSVTLDPQTLDGPTAPVPIEPTDGENITLRLPTQSLDAWNRTIEGLSGAEIDTEASSDEEVVIELYGEKYDLRMAEVGFDGGATNDRFTPIQPDVALDPTDGGAGNGTLPGPNVTDVSEDAGDSVQADDPPFELRANVSNVGTAEKKRGGTPILAAEWYLEANTPVSEGDGTPMDAADGVFLDDIEERVTATVSPDNLSVGNNTLVVRAQDSRGVWGDDTESVTVRLLGPPTVETQAATDVNGSAATLNGELTDLGTAIEVDVLFQYREVGAGTWTNTTTQTRTTTGTFSETITGLNGGTDYEFRAVAESADGSDTGDTLTFTTEGTAAPPVFGTLTADDSGVSQGSSTVTFSWDVTGSFDLVTLDTADDVAVTTTDRNGSATLDTSPGGTQISATVEGPGGTETCDASIGNGDSLSKVDFTCTTTST